ncbi:MAG TPA: methyltransferase [Allosphingosinicella sp.]
MNHLPALLAAAEAHGYSFTTVTPETHRRVLANRAGETAKDLRDVFGWSMAFERGLLPDDVWAPLEGAGMVEPAGEGRWRSRLRISSAAGTLFLHSAFPTEDADSVFFGPDTYRFITFLEAELPPLGARQGLVDMGSGSGAGGIAAARLLPGARLTLADINPAALRLARANAEFAGLRVETLESPGLDHVADGFDTVIANPPFVMDEAGRAYRDGGDLHGLRLSLDWAEQAMARLPSGGAMLLYTGSAIVAGLDGFREALARAAEAAGCGLRYAELDPDIFGELLDEAAYRDVERIAAVGAVLVKG